MRRISRKTRTLAMLAAPAALIAGCQANATVATPSDRGGLPAIAMPPDARLVAYGTPALLEYEARPGQTLYLYDEDAAAAPAPPRLVAVVTAQDSTFRANPMALSMTGPTPAGAVPPLDPGHHYRVYVAGAPFDASTSPPMPSTQP